MSAGRRGLAAGRDGMSLVELMVVMLLFGVIVSGALGFLSVQNRAFNLGADRMSALQEMRYGVHSLYQDLRTLGTNIVPWQPALVYADEDVVVFSADYTSNAANDFSAVFVDVNAPDGEVAAPTSSFQVPNGAASLPDTIYRTGAGTVSPAEMIVFWFAPDTTTTRSDDYALWRQVNSATPELLARNVLKASDGTPFFRFFNLVTPASAAEHIDTVAPSRLPLLHVAVHASPADTGRSALADSVRAVRVTYATTNGVTGSQERIVELSRVVSLPNAGVVALKTCGDEPILGTSLGATAGTSGTGEPEVTLTWSPATDEGQGEQDVIRYVIYRRADGAGDWGDPYLSIPAGESAYTYVDRVVQSGERWQYGLSAQDCTPSLSSMSTSTTVTIP